MALFENCNLASCKSCLNSGLAKDAVDGKTFNDAFDVISYFRSKGIKLLKQMRIYFKFLKFGKLTSRNGTIIVNVMQIIIIIYQYMAGWASYYDLRFNTEMCIYISMIFILNY